MPPLPTATSLIEKLNTQGIKIPPGKISVDSFGDSAELSEELIGLIRTTRKCATTGLLWAYEHDQQRLPEAGTLEIVVDHINEPVLLIRLTSIRIVPFNEVDVDYAALEGEGDGSLAYWQKSHWEFLLRECERMAELQANPCPLSASNSSCLTQLREKNESNLE